MPITHSSVPSLSPVTAPSAVMRLLAQIVVVWQFRHRSRASLARLAPHQLRDIGLDPLSACAEAAKPFWKG